MLLKDWLQSFRSPFRKSARRGAAQRQRRSSTQSVLSAEHLEDRTLLSAGPILVSIDGAGSLKIEDIAVGGQDDGLTIQADTGFSRYVISDPVNFLTTAIAGSSGDGTHTLIVPFAPVTGPNIIVNTLSGSDSLTVDLSLGAFPKVLKFDGGAGSDTMVFTGYNLAPADGVADLTVTHTDANSGSVIFWAGSGSFTFTGLEPLILAGTAADLVVNLPAGPNTDTVIGDDTALNFPGNGTGIAGRSAIDGSTFEYTEFVNATNSLTVNLGNGGDTISMRAMDGTFAPSGVAVAAPFMVNGGTTGNTFNIQATSAGFTTLVTGGGGVDDIYNVSSDAPANVGNLNNINGLLLLDAKGGGATGDILNISESGSAAADTVTVDLIVPTRTISGTSGGGWTVSRTNSIFRGGVNISLGSVGDVVNVLTTGSVANEPITINGNGGDDIFNLGNVANSLDGIRSPITINGNGNAAGDTVNINDQGDADANSYVVTSATVIRNGGPTIAYGTVESLVLNGGAGGNAIDVQSTFAGGPTTVNAGAGIDAITVDSNGGGAGGSVDSIVSLLTINGQGGATNTLSFEDSSDATGDQVTITPTAVGQGVGDNFFGVGGEVIYSGITTLNASFGNTQADTALVTPSATTTYNLNGNNPTALPGDVLVYSGPTAATKTITGANSGSITAAGVMPVNFVSFEQLSTSPVGSLFNDFIDLSSAAFIGLGSQDGLANVVRIARDVTGNLLQFFFDPDGPGVAPEILLSSQLYVSVGTILVTGGTDADTLRVSHANGVVAKVITFNANGPVNSGEPSGDALSITGTPVGGFGLNARETYLVGLTEDAGTWVIDPDDSDGAGAPNTGRNGDEMVINFTGLEPADSDSAVAVFDLIMNGAANNATIENGGLLNGFQSLQVTDNNNTFETTRFANKTTARIMGNGGVDGFRLNATTNAAQLTTLEVYGHLAPGTAGPADDNAGDVFEVNATLGGVQTNAFGQGGADIFTNVALYGPFNSGALALDNFAGNVSIDGGAGSDTFDFTDFLSANGADTATLTNTSLTGASVGAITYSTLETFVYEMTQNDDVLDVLSTQLGTSYLLTGDGGSDTITIGNQTADFVVNADGSFTSDGGSLDAILGPITIIADTAAATLGNNDILNIDDSGTASLAGAATITNTGAGIFTITTNTVTGQQTTLTNFAPATIAYFHGDTAGTSGFGVIGNRLEQLNVFTSTGTDTVAVNATTATGTTRVDMHSGDDNSTLTINGDALSANNIFHGSAGDDQFILNITTHIGSTAVFPVASVEIWGDTNAGPTTGPTDNRDRLIINDNNAAAARQLNWNYLDVAGLIPIGSLDVSPLSATNGLFGANGGGLLSLNLRSMETVIFNSTGTNDITRITGTSQDDDLTVALRNNNSSAFVFKNGNPYIIAPPDSLAGNLPGVAGGGTGPDLLINGINNIGANQGITIDGSGTNAIGNRAIVMAASELAIVTGGLTDIWNLGAGILIPGFGVGNAYDAIAMNGASGVDLGIGAVSSLANQVNVRNNSAGLLVPVTVVPASFVNGLAASSRAGFIVDGGDEAIARAAGPAAGIADNIFATSHAMFNIGVNGNLPSFGPIAADGFPAGDQLNLFSATSFNIWSDKAAVPNVTIVAGNNPFGVINSSIERTRLFPGNGTINLIGDQNNPAIDQNDNFVVVGLDIDPGGSLDGGVQEMAVVINGSAPILIEGVQKLNAYGYDLVGQNLDNPNPNAIDAPIGAAAVNIDTLEITPFADNAGGPGHNAPRGWGVQTVFNEGSPGGQDGNQADLLIVHTSIGVNSGMNVFGGGIVSENISIQPSGPDNGEVRMTNAIDGSVVAAISYINNTDIIVVDDDGSVSDTDTLTLRGTNPNTPQVSGNDTFLVDFDAAGTVAAPFVTVRDSNTGAILYRLRNFTDPGGAAGPFATVNFDMLAGNDSLTFVGPVAGNFASGVNQVNVTGGSGDDSVTLDYSNPRRTWNGRLTYDGGAGADSLSFVDAGQAAFGTVTYTPGPTVGAGRLQTGTGAAGIVDFSNLEPVFDFVAATNLVINAGNANNAINYFTDNGVGTLGAIAAGGAYTNNGVYLNVPLTGGTGTGARADITVAGGTVTVVTLVNDGSDYTIGDNLSAAVATLGGAGAGGLSIPVTGYSATVSIDNQEVLVFANKTNLIINAGNGSDTINLNNPTIPPGLASITVNGGDPTGSDKLIVNGVANVADTFTYVPTGIAAGTVTNTGFPTVTFGTIEHLQIDGQNGDLFTADSLTIDSFNIDGTNRLTPGSTFDSGLVEFRDSGYSLPTATPMNFRGLGVGGSLTFSDSGRFDSLIYLGTGLDDTFTVNATGQLNLNTQIVVNTPGINNLTLAGLDGDDTFNIAGNHDLTSIRVEGGNPSTGDVINFTATGATIVNLGASTIDDDGAAPADVTYTGIETVNVIGAGFGLTTVGTANDDIMDYTPQGATSGRVQLNSVAPVVNFSGVSSFTASTLGTTGDIVVVHGTSNHDVISVNSPTRTVTVTNAAGTVLQPVVLNSDVETVKIEAGLGNDTIVVVPGLPVGPNTAAPQTLPTNLLIEVDGGPPGASDALVIAGTVAGGTLPATDFVVHNRGRNADQGRIRVFRNTGGGGIIPLPDISYSDIEIVSPLVFVNANPLIGPQLLQQGPDLFEQNESFQNAAYLGSASTINVQNLAIFPDVNEHPFVPNDMDFFRVVAKDTGTLDFQIYFNTYNGLLPGGGDIDIRVLDSNGTVIAGSGSAAVNTIFGVPNAANPTVSPAVAAGNNPDERIRIPVVAGQTYYLQVFNAANTRFNTNGYNLTITNTAAAVPYDLELNDALVNGAIVAPGAIVAANRTFTVPVALLNTTPGFYVGKTIHFLTGANAGQSLRIATQSAAGVLGVPTAGLRGAIAAGDGFSIESTDTGRSQNDNVTRDSTPLIIFRLDDDLLQKDLPGNSAGGPTPDQPTRIPWNNTFTAVAGPSVGVAPAADPALFVAGSVTGQIAGYRVAVYEEGTTTTPSGPGPNGLWGYATMIAPGVYQFNFGNTTTNNLFGPAALTNGSHFLTARLEIIDPAAAPGPANAKAPGVRSQSLEVFVDIAPPTVGFGNLVSIIDGLHPTSDSSVSGIAGTIADGVTNVTTPKFWGTAEANSIVRAYLDVDGNGIISGPDILLGQGVAIPTDGTNQAPFGEWQITSTVDLNSPVVLAALGSARDGLRQIIISAEDPAGNIALPNGIATPQQTLRILIDTQGPQINDPDGAGPLQAIQIANPAPQGAVNGINNFNLFATKPANAAQGPTPLVNGLTINIRDLPARALPFVYAAIQNPTMGGPIIAPLGSVSPIAGAAAIAALAPIPIPAGAVALNPADFTVFGDASGNVTILSAYFVPTTPVVPPNVPATGYIVLTFRSATAGASLPDDRFTLTVSDKLVDPANNKLDGENQGVSLPAGNLTTPTGDGQPGGSFVARFNVDSRPEAAVFGQGGIFVDANGNWKFDANNTDPANRDFTFNMGIDTDFIFSGKNSAAQTVATRTTNGFDKFGAYGKIGGAYRWLLDTTDNGVADVTVAQPTGFTVSGITFSGNGIPFTGNFAGPVGSADEVAIFDGVNWFLDTAAPFNVITAADTAFTGTMRGLPIAGDFDGDGRTDLATHYASQNRFQFDYASNGLTGNTDAVINYGFSGVLERPVAGDMNLDGITDIGLGVPNQDGLATNSTMSWYILQSVGAPAPGTNANLNHAFSPLPVGSDNFQQFGNNIAVPLLGNFDPPPTGSVNAAPVLVTPKFVNTATNTLTTTISISTTDANGDVVTTSANASSLAGYLNDSLGLKTNGNYHTNWGGRGEKWIQDANNKWYYITPTGALYRWDLRAVKLPTTLVTGTLVGILDSSVYTNPKLLTDAVQSSVPVTVTTAGSSVTVTRSSQLDQQYVVTVHATDGVASTSSVIMVDTATKAAARLDAELGLSKHGNSYLDNWGGLNEKWVIGADKQWYFITPDGTVRVWDRKTGAHGDVVAKLDPIFHQKPELLVNASVIDLDHEHGFKSNGNLSYNWGGQQEKWFLDKDNAWYFILPTGEVRKWDRKAGTHGELVSKIDKSYYTTPTHIYKAVDDVFSDWVGLLD